MTRWDRADDDGWVLVSRGRRRRRPDRSPVWYAKPTSPRRGREVSRKHRRNESDRWARAPDDGRETSYPSRWHRTPSYDGRRTYASVTRGYRTDDDYDDITRARTFYRDRDASDQRRAPEWGIRPREEDDRAPRRAAPQQRDQRGEPDADHGQYPPDRRDNVEGNRRRAPQSFAERSQHRGRAPPQQQRAEQRRDTRRVDDNRPGDRGRAPPQQRPVPQRDERRGENDGGQRGRFQNFPDRTRTRPEVSEEHTRLRSDDPDFARKCHILHRIIKSVHHFINVSSNKIPLTIHRMMKQLMTFIKPAWPNPETVTLIEENAKNWAHTTVTILCKHYDSAIGKDVEDLSKLSDADWRPPFKVASTWARRNLGRRLLLGTLTEAMAVVVNGLERARGLANPTAPQQPVRQDDTSGDRPLRRRPNQRLNTTAAAARDTAQRQAAAETPLRTGRSAPASSSVVAQVHATAAGNSPALLRTPDTPQRTTQEEEEEDEEQEDVVEIEEEEEELEEVEEEEEMEEEEEEEEEVESDASPERHNWSPDVGINWEESRNVVREQPREQRTPQRRLSSGQGNTSQSPTTRTTLLDEELRVSGGQPRREGPIILTPRANTRVAPLFSALTKGISRPTGHADTTRKRGSLDVRDG